MTQQKNHDEQTAPMPVALDKEPLCLLSEAEINQLRENHTDVKLRRGDVLYREGDEADRIFYVVRGNVKIYKEGNGGRDQIVKMAGPRDVVGYRAVLAAEPHSATAEATSESWLMSIPAGLMTRIMRENTNAAIYVIRQLAKELRDCRGLSVSLTQKQTRGRLAEGLLMLRDKYGMVEGSRQINFKIAREDLASLSNMTTATAIRTLSSFAEEGLVSIAGRDITLLDEPALEKISRLG